MGDVVEHGPDPREGGPSNAVRLAVLVLAVVTAGVLVSRSGLLSADAPENAGRGPGVADGAAEDRAGRLVARLDDRLVRLGQGDPGRGPVLPNGFPGDAPLVPVLGGRGTVSLLGVHHGLLFRVPPRGRATWTAIGRAERVVSVSAPGRALVQRAGEVVEVEVATGRVSQPEPYPGFDASAGWYPEGVVSAVGTLALLMSRPAAPGPAQELALASPARRVEAGTDPPVRALGSVEELLGIAADWVLSAAGDCPGPACRVVVVSVTRDRVVAREVAPPAGWTFSVGPSAGRTHDTLVAVQRDGAPDTRALARLVAGGDNALLLRGSQGVDPGAGLVDAPDGAVYFATGPGGSERRLSVWEPAGPRGAVAVEGPAGLLPAGARLVCVCG